MLNIRYVRVGNDVTCLMTEQGQFIGAVKNSVGGPDVWAFAVDPNEAIVLILKRTTAEGGDVRDLFQRCEQSLLQKFFALPAGEETASMFSPNSRSGDRGDDKSLRRTVDCLKNDKQKEARHERRKGVESGKAQKARVAAEKLFKEVKTLVKEKQKSKTTARRDGATVILEYDGLELAFTASSGGFRIMTRNFDPETRTRLSWDTVNPRMPEEFMAGYVSQWLARMQ
jgi:hypothetical protein